jgi:diguanylate cyclase (GGDEF)-like protein
MPEIGSDAVEAEMRRGFRMLIFPLVLERSFEVDVGRARRRAMIIQNLVGLATYQAFMFGDLYLVADVFRISAVVHVIVMMPLLFLVNSAVARLHDVRVREGLAAATIVVTTLAILFLTLVSQSPLRDSEPLSIVLVIMFATMIQRIRFWYVLGASLASLFLVVVAMSQLKTLPWERMLDVDAVFFGVVVFSLIGCYTLEREQRRSYLLSLRDRLRNAQLEAISRFDPLTQVGNRRALDDVLTRMDAVLTHTSRSTGVLIIDIDHFKVFNDTYGHQAGDACLKRVAAIIAGLFNEEEGSAFRFGGEEFLVLLPNAGIDEAVDAGERIRKEIALPRTLHTPAPAGVTVSVGVSAGMLHAGLMSYDLIAEADQALYAAKQNGRNRVWTTKRLQLRQRSGPA